MTKDVLILADAFSAPAYAPRVRCLCDMLKANGWTPVLYTEKGAESVLPFPHDYTIKEIPYYHCEGRMRGVEWLWKFVAGLLSDRKGSYFAKRIYKEVADREFALVFCTAFHTFPLTVAMRIARKKGLPLHVDLRDLAEQCKGGEYNAHRLRLSWLNSWINAVFRSVNIRRRNRVVRYADAVSTVSPWHVDFLRSLNPSVHLIYNGYDSRQFFPKNISSDAFKITYTGVIYGKTMQDPSLFFEALGCLKREGHLGSEVQCHFYVKEATRELITSYASAQDVSEYMYYHDYVPPTEIPAVLHGSSILLVLANKTGVDGPHGVMTTKFYEALGVEKPVLCVRSDEGCLADVIATTQAGLAAVNVEQVKQFILEKYQEWQRNGYTRQAVDQANKRLFSRQHQAEQFMELFETLSR